MGLGFNLLDWLPNWRDFSWVRAPIPFIGYRTGGFFLDSGSNTLYWLPNWRIFLGFGLQYPLLATQLVDFSWVRAPIPFIGYRTDGFFLGSGSNTLYWLLNQQIFCGFGLPYPLLATQPVDFSWVRAPIPFIGYRIGGFFLGLGSHTLYWLPN